MYSVPKVRPQIGDLVIVKRLRLSGRTQRYPYQREPKRIVEAIPTPLTEDPGNLVYFLEESEFMFDWEDFEWRST